MTGEMPLAPGHFIITGYTTGAGCTYKRNPTYWRKTIINGKEYQIPFIDELVLPIIPDEATRIAALRTAKVDLWWIVPYIYKESLEETNPDLIATEYLSGLVTRVRFNGLPGYKFHNTEFRRALMIALDNDAIAESIFGKGLTRNYPWAPGPYYPSPEETRESVEVLFSYNPELAKQMLVDAGWDWNYVIDIDCGAYPQWDIDLSTMMKAYWEDIGVKANVVVRSGAAAQAQIRSQTFKDIVIHASGPKAVYMALPSYADPNVQAATQDDPTAYEMLLEIQSEMDPVKRTKMVKELGLHVTEQANAMMLVHWYGLNCYWPWLKNFYGEFEGGSEYFMPWASTLWIDQELKNSMGY